MFSEVASRASGRSRAQALSGEGQGALSGEGARIVLEGCRLWDCSIANVGGHDAES